MVMEDGSTGIWQNIFDLRQDSVRTTVDVEENNRVQMVVVFLLFTQ
jgi:hypothetical protein